MKRLDWIVTHQKDLSFECRRCGATDRFDLGPRGPQNQVGVQIDVWLAAAKAFQRVHQSCRERSA